MGGYTQTTIRDINGNIIGYKPVTEAAPFVSGGIVDTSNSLYNQLLGQYNQQHFANVSSSGVVLNQTYQPTRNLGSYADNAVGIVQQVSASGGQVGQNLIDKYNIGKPKVWEQKNSSISDGQSFQSIPFYVKPNLYVAPVERGVVSPQTLNAPGSPTIVDTYFTRGGEPRPNTNPGRFGATYAPLINPPVAPTPPPLQIKPFGKYDNSTSSTNPTSYMKQNLTQSEKIDSIFPPDGILRGGYSMVTGLFRGVPSNINDFDYDYGGTGYITKPTRKDIGGFGRKTNKHISKKIISKKHVSKQKPKKPVTKKPAGKKHDGMFWGI